MREIKFRAWDTVDKIMYNWHENMEWIKDAIPWDAGDEWTERCIVEQYTGRKDREKKEIFEGDKIAPQNVLGKTQGFKMGSINTGIGIVYWAEKECAFRVKYPDIEQTDNIMSTDLLNPDFVKLAEAYGAHGEKVGYMLVVGPKEAESETVAVRMRAGKETKKIGIEEFISKAKGKIADKCVDMAF